MPSILRALCFAVPLSIFILAIGAVLCYVGYAIWRKFCNNQRRLQPIDELTKSQMYRNYGAAARRMGT